MEHKYIILNIVSITKNYLTEDDLLKFRKKDILTSVGKISHQESKNKGGHYV